MPILDAHILTVPHPEEGWVSAEQDESERKEARRTIAHPGQQGT